MPRVFYEPAAKDAIIKAALGARSEKKTWNEAHAAAKAVGYQGSAQGIIKLINSLEKRKGKPGRKPGRPAGKKAKRKYTRRAIPAASANIATDIAGMVNKLVSARINEALNRAIAVLQGAKG